MIVLRRQFNYKVIQLSEEPSAEVVGVLTKQGDYTYVQWGGFIKLATAKSYDTAKPVKLEISEYTLEYSIAADWTKVPPGKHVQGCLMSTPDGHSLRVYGITVDGAPRII